MLVTMRQIATITRTGVTPETAYSAISAWLSRRPLEAQRVLCTEIPSQAATAVVASMEKARIKR